MIIKLFFSFCLMALCVTIHAMGIMWLLRRIDCSNELTDSHFWVPTRCLIRVACWLVSLHLVEICLWGLIYLGWQVLPDFPTAFYFSSVTYTTVGYGDVVLPREWRLVGGIEALTGILMCGWSTGFFFTLVDRIHQNRGNSFTRN